ncbi:hypothetical protein [Dendronalium sp. ChiSLP03b]|uniref:hypothetical protein n=1 Tax=Dendronalium sp. ChiSLP03b TaxID=3075381 RepID=UPI002AD2EDF8|nr:hypothetical protein [Dendronalium sp. ChiSLP03b]MDZ8204652.1 hypothetical protein [Dendronalium sp. ChiSLP03b]
MSQCGLGGCHATSFKSAEPTTLATLQEALRVMLLRHPEGQQNLTYCKLWTMDYGQNFCLMLSVTSKSDRY